MTHLFARGNEALLEKFARSKVLLGFDYDGTLAPLVGTPERAAMRSTTRRLLTRVSARYPCVVISGRARADASSRLRGVGIRRVIGSHGAEPSSAEAKLKRRVRRWLPVLRAQLSQRKGVVIEDKGVSVAIHYRRARARTSARRTIMAAVRSLDDVRVVGGKLAINLLVPGAPHKGAAVEHERSRSGCKAVIYVGDDDTDEDVFQLARLGRLLSIRVGRKRTSAAQYYIRGQVEIDRLLATLAGLRQCHDQ